MKNNTRTKKLALAGVLCTVGVVGSLFSFPVFGSKCAPVQHMVNIICAVLLGPFYGVGVAFTTSIIRNLLGLGSPLAFPGSMFGALRNNFPQDTQHSVDIYRGSFRNSCPRRSVCLSCSDTLNGRRISRCCFLRIHCPIPHLYSGRSCLVSGSR